MSRLRQLSDEVLNIGKERRKHWSPDPDSDHYKRYAWWVEETCKANRSENFCHYMRVAYVWAPLRRYRKPLQIMLGVLLATTFLVGVTLLFMLFKGDMVKFTLTLCAVAYAIGAVAAAGNLLHEYDDKYYFCRADTVMDLSRRTRIVLYVLFAPAITVYLLLGFTVYGVCMLMALPFREGRLCRRTAAAMGTAIGRSFMAADRHVDTLAPKLLNAARWTVRKRFGERRPLSMIRPWMILPAAVMILAVWYDWARVLTIVFVIVAGFAATVRYFVRAFARVELPEWYELRRKYYDLQPGDPGYGIDPDQYEIMVLEETWKEHNARFRREHRLLAAIVDCTVLTWAYVRSWKMGFCPLVDLPDDRAKTAK